MITQSTPTGGTLSPPLSLSFPPCFSWRGAPQPSNRFDWKASSPRQPIPHQYRTHKHTQGFRGNCSAGGRQNDLVYRASQTMVMRGRGLHQRVKGRGALLVHGRKKTDRERKRRQVRFNKGIICQLFCKKNALTKPTLFNLSSKVQNVH